MSGAAAARLFFRGSQTFRSRSRFSASAYCSGFTTKRIPIRRCRKRLTKHFATSFLYQMPVGIRGLLIAGIFATAMGSLSTALNALATSFTRDWYEPYINPAIDERTKSARGALGHGVVCDPDDHCRIDHFLSRDRASQRADHPDRAGNFRLHLWFAARSFSLRNVHQAPRQRLAATSSR